MDNDNKINKLDEYIQEYQNDVTYDRLNIEDIQLKLPANKAKWIARLINNKKELNSLHDILTEAFEKITEKIKTESVIAITTPIAEKSAEKHELIKKIKKEIKNQQLIVEFLEKIESPNVIELGTCRSFVDGKFEGCNLDDPKYWDPADFSKWDWGAGCFSLVFGQISECNLITLDLESLHIKRCKIMTDSLGIKCSHVVSDSLSFLSSTVSEPVNR